ncbi:MAG: Ig-like domain-containing protein [Planctomycetota bacterium]
MRKNATLAFALAFCFVTAAQAATIWRVTPTGSDTGSGADWTTNASSLQHTLTAQTAVPGDEIWVKTGTYKPTASTDRTICFYLKAGVGIYGGFTGTETAREQRNWTANVTTLSGDIGDAGNEDNSFHVVVANGDMANAVMDGFTVSGGNANGGSDYNNNSGGAYFNQVIHLAVTNCAFSGNSASRGGGGMYNNDSSPTITNCIFSGNSAAVTSSSSGGGGMYNNSSSPIVTNCIFSDNSATATAGGYGGGMYNYSAPSSPITKPIVTNCTFSNNSAFSGGGGMYNNNSSPTVTNCIFNGNSAKYGGGMRSSPASSPTVTNCTFSNNSASAASSGGGGMYNTSSSLVVTNCIMWGDIKGEIVNASSATPTVSYSCIEGGYAGTGNISTNPSFVDAATGDFHLQIASPCIDKGNNAAVPESVITDLDGNRRFNDATGSDSARVDMGAYERAWRPWAVPDAASTLEDVAVTIAVLTNDVTINGSVLTIKGATSGANGTVTHTSNQVVYTPNANFNGSDSFTYTISTGVDLPDTGTVNVIVTPVNDAPVASDGTLSVIEDTIANGSFVASDVDSDSLTFSLVTDGAKGHVIITDAATGAYTYTPNLNANGDDSFTFKVNDGLLDSNIAAVTVTINPVNDAPISSDGALTVIEDTPAVGALVASDVDDDPLTFSLVTDGANGHVVITNAATGAYTYTPNLNVNGGDSFTFKVNDKLLDSNIATVIVTIKPVNDAPTFAKGSDQTILEDCEVTTVDGWATLFDPGQLNEIQTVLRYIVSNDNNALFSTQPAISTDGTLTYTLAPNAWGVAIATVCVQDNGGTTDGGVDTSDSQTFTITITPVNDAPTLNSIASPIMILRNASAQTINLSGISAGLNDPPKTLMITATSSNTSLIPNPTVNYTNPGATGSLTYTPVTGAVGAATITVSVTDNGGTINGGINTISRAFDVIVDVPLMITSPLLASAIKGSPFSYQIATLGGRPIMFKAGGLPSGLALSGDTISGTPTVSGVRFVTLKVTNSTGVDTKTLKLTITGHGDVTDSPPTITSAPTANPNPTQAGQTISFTVGAYDPDTEMLLYSWDFGDGDSGIGASVWHTYTAAGLYTVKVVVSDGGASDSRNVIVAVNDSDGTGTDPKQFAVLKASIKFCFNKKNSDSLVISGTLPVEKGFNPDGKTITLLLGDYQDTLTLNNKGKSVDGNASIKLSGKISQDREYTASPVKFLYSVKKAALFDALQNYGFTNDNVSKSANLIDIPVIVILGNDSYLDILTVLYTAKKDKIGSGKK